MNGIFVSFEGIEGSGKSTQARLLGEYLRGKGREVVTTEEPGGTEIGRAIRAVLLDVRNKAMDSMTELLLYNASRAQHLRDVIIPSLDRGMVVITDRFSDSTLAYQGYGRGIEHSIIRTIDRIATNGIMPDITILLDIDVETGLRRNIGVGKDDRFEQEDIDFHRKVRAGYLDIAGMQPDRIFIIDAANTVEAIHKQIIEVIERRCLLRT